MPSVLSKEPITPYAYTDFIQNMEWVEPVDESPAAVQAANLATERCIDWVKTPIALSLQAIN